ncbi:MAG: ABC transporter permease [Bacilli bacterium]|nr:ABC transporter permease [Bacilli bacterium]
MYIIKNAWKSITRAKGRNILIGIIITIVTISACISLAINKSSDTLVNSYKNNNPIEVSFQLDPSSLMNATTEEKESFETLTVDMIEEYGNSSLVSDYYYTLEASMSSDEINPVDYSTLTVDENAENENDSNRPKMDSGDFRLTAYSDFSYLEDFISGTKKITEGSMIEKDNTENVIVISEDLAEENDLELNDTITLYSNDEDTTYKFEIIGIYEDTSDVSEDSFAGMTSMNSRNQMYTNLTSLNEILEEQEDTTSENTKRMMSRNGLSAKFYLNDNDTLDEFEDEVREKGLSTYYSVNTNESETLATLEPIQNISNFSMTFLIVIFIVGAIVLTVINLINIRERKYEIGVLRAIGMSKLKVTAQLVSEIFIVSIISLLIGTSIGTLASQPVANMMLKGEIESYKEEVSNTQNNFGNGNFQRPSMNQNNNPIRKMAATDYVDSLSVSIDIITIIQLICVSMSLTLISGIVAVLSINKYEPNKILQNR